MKFDMEDIDWKALDFFLEEVENGYYSKEELLNNENFLAMLAAVKYDKANWKKIPHYIKQRYLCKEFCLWVNPDITIDNMSPIQKYRAYLGMERQNGMEELSVNISYCPYCGSKNIIRINDVDCTCNDCGRDYMVITHE